MITTRFSVDSSKVIPSQDNTYGVSEVVPVGPIADHGRIISVGSFLMIFADLAHRIRNLNRRGSLETNANATGRHYLEQ
jgi:hypothetical protein